MQYWINQDGVQMGPLELEELKAKNLNSQAYVWREGLDDWVKIIELQELDGLYQVIADPMSATEATVGNEEALQTAISSEPSIDSQLAAGEDASLEIPPIPEAVVGQPYIPPIVTGRSMGTSNDGRSDVPYSQQARQRVDRESDKCPPTNMVWAIITTVLCCLPAGVIAIVYACKVTSCYQRGDIAGAKRASETGAWWCIASIVLGIICQPLLLLLYY